MKKLLLITFLFLITPDAKADMDYVCIVDMTNAFTFIKENCERNNILSYHNISTTILAPEIAYWCRQDREINYVEHSNGWDLTCVLYDNKPRKNIPQ